MGAWSWFTRGRRIPTLIGKDVSGRRIPGGPYTGLQAVAAAAIPGLLWWSRPVWAADMAGLAMFAVIAGVTFAAVRLLGKVDFASRNPLLLLAAYLRQACRPAGGTLAGRSPTTARAHRVRCAVDYLTGTASTDTRDRTDTARTDTAQEQPQPDLAAAPATEPNGRIRRVPDRTAHAVVAGAAQPRETPRTVQSPGNPAGPVTAAGTVPRRSGLESFLAGAGSASTTEETAA